MSLFSSKRERRLWLWTLIVMVAIYSTLGPARILAQELRERHLLELSFVLVVLLLAGGISWRWLKERPSWSDIGVALGVLLAYLAAFARMQSPEERTHLIEYGIVAALIHLALQERVRQGHQVSSPAAIAVVATALLGLIDEGIQAMLPSRVFDTRDIFFNALAGFLAIAAMLAIAPQRGPGWRLWFLWLMAAAYGWGTAVEMTGLGEMSMYSSPPSIEAGYFGVALAGMLVGALQWLILRKKISGAGWWILASFGAALVFSLVVFGVGLAYKEEVWRVGVGLLGPATGLLQWLILRREVRQSGWWILASTLGWGLGIPAGEAVGWNGLGAVYGALTGLALVFLLRQESA